MIYLFLDTSIANSYFLAIIRGEKIDRYKIEGTDLFTQLPQFVLNEKIDLDEIERFYVIVGIGSYQGLKNGISFLLGLTHKRQNLYGISIFDFMRDDLLMLKSWRNGYYVYSYLGREYLELTTYDDIMAKFPDAAIVTNDDKILDARIVSSTFYREDRYLLRIRNYESGRNLAPIYAR